MADILASVFQLDLWSGGHETHQRSHDYVTGEKNLD